MDSAMHSFVEKYVGIVCCITSHSFTISCSVLHYITCENSMLHELTFIYHIKLYVPHRITPQCKIFWTPQRQRHFKIDLSWKSESINSLNSKDWNLGYIIYLNLLLVHKLDLSSVNPLSLAFCYIIEPSLHHFKISTLDWRNP